MTVSNFAVAGRPLQQSAADRRLDKSVGVMFHHLADLVKIFHVIDFRHAGKLPDTLVQKRQLHPFLAFFLQGRSFFTVFFFLHDRSPEKLRPFLAFLLQGPNREELPQPDSPSSQIRLQTKPSYQQNLTTAEITPIKNQTLSRPRPHQKIKPHHRFS